MQLHESKIREGIGETVTTTLKCGRGTVPARPGLPAVLPFQENAWIEP